MPSLHRPTPCRLGLHVATGLLALMAGPSWAHVSYDTRDLGSFDGVSATRQTIDQQGVKGDSGWADAAQATFGDSHQARWYRFTLTQDATVTLTAESSRFSVTSGRTCGSGATGDTPRTCEGGWRPGFSVYQGLVTTNPAVHDHAASTMAYLIAKYPDGRGGTTQNGAWHALGTTVMGNDAGQLSTLTLMGHAFDGQLPGLMGDGVPDGRVIGTFKLNAGHYSIALGSVGRLDRVGAAASTQAAGHAHQQAQAHADASVVLGVRLSIHVLALPRPVPELRP